MEKQQISVKDVREATILDGSVVGADAIVEVGDPAILALENLDAIKENDGLSLITKLELSFKLQGLK